MKFTRELGGNVNIVRAYDAGVVRVGDRAITQSCLFNATQLVDAWPPRSVAELTVAHFDTALAWEPEIVLLGTGVKQTFPSREIYAAILARGIGFEVMDTGAACRTYNVLVGEDRRVAAGLILEGVSR